jgi:hypothetical protein
MNLNYGCNVSLLIELFAFYIQIIRDLSLFYKHQQLMPDILIRCSKALSIGYPKALGRIG